MSGPSEQPIETRAVRPLIRSTDLLSAMTVRSLASVKAICNIRINICQGSEEASHHYDKHRHLHQPMPTWTAQEPPNTIKGDDDTRYHTDHICGLPAKLPMVVLPRGEDRDVC